MNNSAARGQTANDDPIGTDSPRGRFTLAYCAKAGSSGSQDKPTESAIASHHRLASSRPAGTARVEVTAPAGSTHSRLQIVVDDMPWLVSSLRACLETRGHRLTRLVHPLIRVRRSEQGDFQDIADDSDDAPLESFMYAELEALDESARDALEQAVVTMLATLALVHESLETNTRRLGMHADRMTDPEQAAFLNWLDSRQFVPFGAARVALDTDGHPKELSQQTGLMATDAGRAAWVCDDFLPGRLDAAGFDPDLSVFLCKAGRVSPLIRHEHADLIMIAERDDKGVLLAVDCIVGLFVPGLQAEAVSAIPWLRDRVSRVLQASNIDERGHAGKSVMASLRSLPRDMLLHNRTSRLADIAQGIAHLQQQPRTRVFSSTDPLGRYWNALVYLPADVYSRDLRLAIERHLEHGLKGHSTSFESTFSSNSALARIHFVIRVRTSTSTDPDWSEIERIIAAETVSWQERFSQEVAARVADDQMSEIAARYCDGFPSDYRERYSVETAMQDALFIDTHLKQDAPAMSPLNVTTDGSLLSFRLHAHGAPVSLSQTIPLIESLGFRIHSERPFEIKRRDQASVHSHVFHVSADAGSQENPNIDSATSQRISDTFRAAWIGAAENDGFNRLVFAAGLNWQQANVLRTIGKYALQTRAPFSIDYMIDTLVANPHIARLIVELFEKRLSPEAEQAGCDADDVQQQIMAALDAVASLDEDRILRRFSDTVLAVLRTNHWCRDEQGRALDYLSLKLDCALVPDLPKPRPAFEIFVSSPKVDGVHLRGGTVARGGLRWSDRREDYRTEVLGLMKAQQVKNAVIVPVGSKGGFYVKSDLPEDRAQANEIVLDAYRTFLSGLLDVTDNLSGTDVVPPENVVRRDGDDPYLVVAADKGTASFSDHANAVAMRYDFWLGDGFASGGSVGYDHKKMGITARGAWESVKRHFRGLGIDTQAHAFTVVGIGDMSGDVFGNGMLLSPHIRLVAAFDHRHVFIDPDPTTAEAHAERTRLFNEPRSSWDDYDRSLISEGGGIWARTEKRIPLSQQMRTALGTDEESMTPDQMVSAILAAPVDLLWNGGIGTYVKASHESQSDAADRGNDAVRIDAKALRCRVIGEGGNLGFTQNARIEYAAGGGLMYTDAIDNSAGVDCSDHEVNIKILLNAAIDSGDLAQQERDALLESMTDEVADLVLQDNYRQTGCIDAHFAEGVSALDDQAAVLDAFEATGRLDRAIEFLPDAETLNERVGNGLALTRPEIAVLVSYAKMSLYDEVLASSLPDKPALHTYLVDYFPTPLHDRFPTQIKEHRLAREIIATVVTNDVINCLGPVWVERRKEEFGVSGAQVAEAFLATRSIFSLDAMTASIDSLDNKVDHATQSLLAQLTKGLAERGTHWILRTLREASPSDEQIAQWSQSVAELSAAIPACLSEAPAGTYQQRVAHFVAAKVPEDIATHVASVVPLSSALDIVEIARTCEQPVQSVANLYFEVGEFLDLHWLRDAIAELEGGSRLHTRARTELRSDLHYRHRHLTAEIASFVPDGTATARLEHWQKNISARVSRYRVLLHDIHTGVEADYVTLSLAINELHKLMQPR